MFKKLNKKGFTLAELLVVVAIIGVLVAISIPIFTSQLEKSREAVDISNMRAAYAIAQTDILTEDYDDTTKYTGTVTDGAGTKTGYYDVDKSAIVATKPTNAYGKSTVSGTQSSADFPGNATFTFDGQESGKVIKVTITFVKGSDPKATLAWE